MIRDRVTSRPVAEPIQDGWEIVPQRDRSRIAPVLGSANVDLRRCHVREHHSRELQDSNSGCRDELGQLCIVGRLLLVECDRCAPVVRDWAHSHAAEKLTMFLDRDEVQARPDRLQRCSREIVAKRVEHEGHVVGVGCERRSSQQREVLRKQRVRMSATLECPLGEQEDRRTIEFLKDERNLTTSLRSSFG